MSTSCLLTTLDCFLRASDGINKIMVKKIMTLIICKYWTLRTRPDGQIPGDAQHTEWNTDIPTVRPLFSTVGLSQQLFCAVQSPRPI